MSLKGEGAKGLAYTKAAGGKLEGGIGKFLEPVTAELIEATGAKDGDLIFFGADDRKIVNKVLGQVRSKLGDLLGLKDPKKLAFAWITDFPMYEIDEKTGKIDFAHNPFSMPKGGLEAFNKENPLEIESNQYDVTLNGFEILSGSIRNHDPELMVKAFEIVGYGEEEVKRRFGGLYNAFQYGAPPHGGWAIGIDRMFMVFTEEPNIRDVYAFPTAANGEDLMMNAPSEAYPEDLQVLGIEISDKGDLVVNQIRELIDGSGAEYKFMEHEPVRTSEQAAKIRGTKVSEGAKALVLKSLEYAGKYIMVVIPADKQLDLEKVEKVLGEKFDVAPAEEVESYTGVQMGGVPPFGRLLKLEVYFDKQMWEKEMSAFNCGRKDRSIYMKTSDLIKLVQPNKIAEEYTK
ncbi:MAG: amino acid--tRNA ligase-related protein [Candidatus Dojkabacteria bacterium]|nr:MAG: amino acid--tRNA ligase-related protein [Candidatus Dojkabacteria bacterium]